MALEGTLQEMSLSDLIQVFRMGPKTGILLMVSGDERGVLYVADGRLVDAIVVRGPDRKVVEVQDEAVLHMLLWNEANFVFRHDLAVRERPPRIKHDGEWLVMESMRRRDDPTSALPYHKLNLDTHIQLSPLPSDAESGVSLDVNQWRILSQVSSHSNLRTISEITGITPEQVIRTVAELMSVGLVEIMPVAPPPPKPRPSRPELVARGEPALAGVPAIAGMGADGQTPSVGRGLLDAIMRRVRGL